METKFINFKQFSHDHSFLSVPKPKKVVFDSLKEEDEIAYVRFASVFMEFEGLSDFKQILK